MVKNEAQKIMLSRCIAHTMDIVIVKVIVCYPIVESSDMDGFTPFCKCSNLQVVLPSNLSQPDAMRDIGVLTKMTEALILP